MHEGLNLLAQGRVAVESITACHTLAMRHARGRPSTLLAGQLRLRGTVCAPPSLEHASARLLSAAWLWPHALFLPWLAPGACPQHAKARPPCVSTTTRTSRLAACCATCHTPCCTTAAAAAAVAPTL
jgi:hypothetical protein